MPGRIHSIYVEDAEFLSQSLQFVVGSGAGPRRYKEYARGRVEMVKVGAALASGREVVGNYVLLDGGYLAPGATRALPSLLFPAPGTYSVKAVYVAPGTQDVLAESNAVTFTVGAPTGDEAAVFDILERETYLRDGGGDLARLKAVIQAHPQSRYLRRAKMALFERRANALQNRKDPDTGESLWSLDDPDLAALRKAQYAAMAQDLISDSDWGAFEEERLNLAMLYGRAADAVEIAQQAQTELLQRFSSSQAVIGIHEREAALAEAAREDRETDDTGSPSKVYFLHGIGPNANPPSLVLDAVAPTATTTKYKDSTSINFSGGNPWKEVGTWTAGATGLTSALSTAGDLHAWAGLKNSDDQGTQFDVKADVTRNGAVVASGTTLCVTGVTRNASLAKEVTVPITVPAAAPFASSDAIGLRILTRIGTNPNGSKCSGPGGSHNNAVGLRVYFDATDRAAKFSVIFQP